MDPRIAWTCHQLERALHDPRPPAALAADAGLSVREWARLFRAETGLPLPWYRRALRIARAGILLERTFLTVDEVMDSVGERHPGRFARDFRRAYGVWPHDVRGHALVGSLRVAPRRVRCPDRVRADRAA